ncbi:hypothetical protein LZ198_27875 [Myxococcus sp. K15C18031901]|uniref:hypothetical protein n=1 Tax=Myxococcus dinghuensis TaxID=2906761 RepID=UPI0020A7CB46|nr:hypothetical protein [Myxococcus dinghuensis]MCP3102700.1 hypothetical protein [Myxococcus dinghuensis]
MLRTSSASGARWLPACLLLVGCGSSLGMPDEAAVCEGFSCSAGTCFSNAGQPMCRCGPWEAAAGVSCKVARYTVADDHGGSPALATPLALDAPFQDARINSEPQGTEDFDLFRFDDARPGHAYSFHCEGLTLPFCDVRLLASTGRPVTDLMQYGREGMWLFRPDRPGVWFIEVTGAGAVGTYRFTLRDLGPDTSARP